MLGSPSLFGPSPLSVQRFGGANVYDVQCNREESPDLSLIFLGLFEIRSDSPLFQAIPEPVDPCKMRCLALEVL